jgi:four helix bundle protein
MKFESIENLIVWQKARTLAVETFAAFKSAQEGVLKELIQRAPVMIMNTIAEAYERPSKKELIDSLYVAKIACGPCRSMFHMAVEM